MRSFLLTAGFLFVFGALLQAQTEPKWETATFKVFGNCGMCEKRIEDALFIPGVKLADWDVDSQVMTVTYKPSKITLQSIHEKIAEIGHDTELVKAKDDVYENLHSCCKYERSKI